MGNTKPKSATNLLRRLIDKLDQYEIDQEMNDLVTEGKDLLAFFAKRSANASQQSAASGKSGRKKIDDDTIQRIINATGSLRQIAKSVGGVSVEGVRKILHKHKQGLLTG